VDERVHRQFPLACNFRTASESATNDPVMAAVRVPPSALQHVAIDPDGPLAQLFKSSAARMARPIRR